MGWGAHWPERNSVGQRVAGKRGRAIDGQGNDGGPLMVGTVQTHGARAGHRAESQFKTLNPDTESQKSQEKQSCHFL